MRLSKIPAATRNAEAEGLCDRGVVFEAESEVEARSGDGERIRRGEGAKEHTKASREEQLAPHDSLFYDWPPSFGLVRRGRDGD